MCRLFTAVLLLSLSSLFAGARLIEWEATSGLLPWDPAIPADSRFAVHEEASFATLVPDAIHVNDNVVSKRLLVDRAEPFGTAWALQIDARIIDVDRPGLALALQSGIADGDWYIPLGVTPSAVGFVDATGSAWILGFFYALDTTDAIHRYDVQRVAGLVHLYVDGSANPVISMPINLFQSTNTERALLLATSIAGTAEFEIERFHVETGAALTAVPNSTLLDGMDLRAAPNPFNPSTTISYRVDRSGPVEIDIFDARGRIVRRLLRGVRSAGDYRIAWYGRDDSGRAVASGSYWARLRAAGGTQVHALALVK